MKSFIPAFSWVRLYRDLIYEKIKKRRVLDFSLDLSASFWCAVW